MCEWLFFTQTNFKESLLTSRVWIFSLRHRYPCLQSPPCSSNTQNTRGDTCVLRRPGTENAKDNLPFRQEKKKVSRDQEAAALLSCVMDQSAVCRLFSGTVTQREHLLHFQSVWNLLWCQLQQVWVLRLFSLSSFSPRHLLHTINQFPLP